MAFPASAARAARVEHPGFLGSLELVGIRGLVGTQGILAHRVIQDSLPIQVIPVHSRHPRPLTIRQVLLTPYSLAITV